MILFQNLLCCYNLYYNYFKITSIYHGSLFFGKIDVWERFCAMVWWKTTFNFSSSNSLLYSNQTRVETSEWPLAIFVFKSQRLPSCQLIILNHSPTTVWERGVFFFLQTYVVFLVVYISLMFGSYNISLFYSSFGSFRSANMWSLSSSAALTYHMTFRKPQQCDDDDEDDDDDDNADDNDDDYHHHHHHQYQHNRHHHHHYHIHTTNIANTCNCRTYLLQYTSVKQNIAALMYPN